MKARSKRAIIEQYFDEWRRNEISKEEIALIAKTTTGYVYSVFLNNRIRLSAKIEQKGARRNQLVGRFKKIVEPKFDIENQIKGLDVDDLVKEINGKKIIPTVNLLTDGRVELIYKSRM